MKEKILEALKTKFNGVKDAILDRVATKLAETVKQEDQIETAVGGITFDTLFESELDRRVTEASTTAVSNYEKKHKIKDGKPIEDPEKKKEPEKKDEGGKSEEIPEWAKGLTENLKTLSETVQGVTKAQQTASKQSQAAQLLKDSKIPEKYQKLWLPRINLDDEEKSLEDQVKALETEYLDLKQELVNESVDDGEFGKGGKGEASDGDMKEFLDEKFPGAEQTAEAK